MNVSVASPSSSRHAPTSKDIMVGFDDDLMEIKTRLCGESSKLQVIPIYGMGGIGKTTLAQNAFCDPLTVEHFQIRIWVTVSQDYNAQAILSTLLVSVNEFNDEREQSNESVEENVYKSLKGKRYLIVMDDIWSTNVWDDVRRIFPDDNNGSRIMLTTRLADVANYPYSSSPLHEMRFMNADQSWNLLKQKVFTRDNCPSELENIGKEITRSCGGLPLAIVVVAGILSTVSRTPASWVKIARNVNQAISTTNDDQFTKILSLSYTHLPRHLRQCFLYMGGFREDYEIHVSKLIKLWIAEGFLKSNESKRFEERAEEYLEDLVKRSLVLVTKRKSNGKIKCCNIHDLLRDLCMRKARESKLRMNVLHRNFTRDVLQNIKNTRRVSISHSYLSSLANIYGSKIRTIIYFHHGTDWSFNYLRNFRLLKVLDVVMGVRSSEWNSLPDEVFELSNLKYLAFDYALMAIPTSISNLKNLQTLIIHPRKNSRNSVNIVVLPLELLWMPQLRHLVSFSFHLLPNPERATFVLENLQTLSDAVDFICSEEILKMIPNLKKLGITFAMNTVEDYQLNNLFHLEQLEKLKLKIHPFFQRNLHPIFPTSLKKLVLSGNWGFSWKYMGGIVGSLPNLEVLKLRDSACNEETWETREGEFLQLKFLLIKYSPLSQWITESSHFPSLKCLKLYFCRYLNEIPDGIGEIPTLELIEVHNINKSLVKSAKRIQKEQEENCGHDVFQVRIARRNFK